MKCMKCGYQSTAPFNRCPSCGTVQTAYQPVSSVPYYPNTRPRQRTGGELAAIIVAVIISVVSFIASLIIFAGYLTYIGTKAINNDDFNINSFEDFDEDEFDKDFDDFFDNYLNGKDKDGSASRAGLNSPLSFKEKLYSFSEGEVETEYEVRMTETYRGEAALKLLEGAALPIYNDDMYDIYLVKFNIKITNQDKDAIVTCPMGNPAAYPTDEVNIIANSYSFIDKLDYANRYALIGKGDSVDTWAAFIVEKDEAYPAIQWSMMENKFFCSKEQAITDPDSVESGAAIEVKNEASSEEPTDDTASDGDASSN